MSYRILTIGICSFLLFTGLAASQAVERTAEPQTFEAPGARYRIQNGDVVDLSFPFTPEFNQVVTVQPDGYVTLRGIGDVEVAGKSVPQVTTMLQEKYSAILREPVITVLLKEFEKPHFLISGHVGRPGKYDMSRDLTLSQAVAIGGGLIPDAKSSQVLVFRRTSKDWVEVKKVDLGKMLKGDLNEDIALQPGDMVYIPKKKLASLKPFMPVAALRLWFEPF